MAKRRQGAISLDPRTHMGLLILFTVITFAVKPLWLEVAMVIVLALLQLLCGHVRMSLAFLVAFALLVWTLDYAFAAGAAVFLSSFVYSFTLARRAFEVFMVAALLVGDNSVHRITAALRKLHVPEAVLVPFATGLRYFPTFAEEAGHIRDALRLRDIPASEKVESFVVPLMMSAATCADELSRAAVCRGIENPAPRTDTERLHMGAVDWTVLAVAAAFCAYVLLGHAT